MKKEIALIGVIFILLMVIASLLMFPDTGQKPFWQATETPTPTATNTPTPTPTLTPTPTPKAVFDAVAEPIPDQVSIMSGNLFLGNTGTGYLAEIDGKVVVMTVFHLFYNDFLNIENENVKMFGFFEYDCFVNEEINDGPCQIYQDEETEANIIRDVSQVPEEVVVYSPAMKVWMPYKVIGSSEYGVEIKGSPIDLDGDLQPDVISYICEGMSGSPAIESKDGVPVLNADGKLIARGELTFSAGINIGHHCTDRGIFINLEMK